MSPSTCLGWNAIDYCYYILYVYGILFPLDSLFLRNHELLNGAPKMQRAEIKQTNELSAPAA